MKGEWNALDSHEYLVNFLNLDLGALFRMIP